MSSGATTVDDLGALVDLLVARPSLAPSPGGKLPWANVEFSARMLREHLDQTHDRASRRSATIDAHVDWIFRDLLAARPGWDAGEVTQFTDTLHALTDHEYRDALVAAGFETPIVRAHAGAFTDPAMVVVTARVPGSE